ncbi:hypothetical protein Aperf_G00000128761 [Anoplocephala perfoliata]
MDSADAFSQMSNVDANQEYPLDCSKDNPHEFPSPPNEINRAVPLNCRKVCDGESQEQWLKRSFSEVAATFLSIPDSADLEMHGTITLKDEKSCKAIAVNFSDTPVSSQSKHPVTHTSKRKRVTSSFCGIESDAIVSNFEIPNFSKHPSRVGVISHEAPACASRAGPSPMELNETGTLLATSSHLEKALKITSASPMILPQSPSLLDVLNHDRNKSMAPSGSGPANSSPILSPSILYLPPATWSFLAPKTCRNSEDAFLENSNNRSGMKTLRPYQIPTTAPTQYELLSKAALFNMLALLSQISTNSSSQPLMIPTDTNHRDESNQNCVNLARLSTVVQEIESQINVPSGLFNPFMSESRHLNANQAQNAITRQQPERIRRKRGRRPSEYICNLCNEAFRKIGDLNLHTKGKHGCYQCHLCQTKFTHRSNLQRHYPIHSGDRQYKCLHCPKDYLRSDHLKRHMVRDHPGYDPGRDTFVFSEASEDPAHPKPPGDNALSEECETVMGDFQNSFAERSAV